MNPLLSAPGRAVVSFLISRRNRRRHIVSFRLMNKMPLHMKRDVGWPPYGNLDEQGGS